MHSSVIAIFIVIIATNAKITSSLNHGDLIVAWGDQLELLTNGSTFRRLPLPSYNATKLYSLAYDAGKDKLFFSDKRHSRGHIFSVDISSDASHPVRDIVEKSTNESVGGLAYDPVDQMLFWTDGLKRSIRRMRIDHDEAEVEESVAIELVHLMEGHQLRDLVADSCTRMLYWTNWNTESPTIERSFLNGSRREVLVNSDLFMPHALALDVRHQNLYWGNNQRLSYFQIERSFVDGSNRQLIYRGVRQFVFGLTVGEDYLYWTDWDHKNLWALPKEVSSLEEPILLRQYSSKPMAVVLRPAQPFMCNSLPQELIDQATKAVAVRPENDVASPLREASDMCQGHCFNGGQCLIVNDKPVCSCEKPFSGERCDSTSAEPDRGSDWVCRTVMNSLGRTEMVTLNSLAIVCAFLLAAVVLLAIRLWKLSANRRPSTVVNGRRCRNNCRQRLEQDRPAFAVPDIENCCDSIGLCERPCGGSTKLQTMQTAQWTDFGDKTKLLNCEM